MPILDVREGAWRVTVRSEEIVAIVPDVPGEKRLILVLHGETLELPAVVGERVLAAWLAADGKHVIDGDAGPAD